MPFAEIPAPGRQVYERKYPSDPLYQISAAKQRFIEMDSAPPVAFKTERHSLPELSKSISPTTWYIKDGITAIAERGAPLPPFVYTKGGYHRNKEERGADGAEAAHI